METKDLILFRRKEDELLDILDNSMLRFDDENAVIISNDDNHSLNYADYNCRDCIISDEIYTYISGLYYNYHYIYTEYKKWKIKN